ncbi:MAG: GMC family oxidoreductase [Myxococcota bacterium]
MRQLPVLPDRPEDESWDVIVIGTGMGGGTVGHALAKMGHRVLFLEKGYYLFGEHDRGEATLGEVPRDDDERMRRGHWPKPIRAKTSLGDMEFHGPYGCGTGGSTSVYAAQLERMRPEDFEPRRYHAKVVQDSTAPERWPFGYDALVPYYRRAEELYDVCGSQDPLLPDPASPIRQPPEMSPRDALIYEAMEEAGASPYRAHVGALFVDGCTGCGGRLCPRGCKAESGRNAVVPALQHHGASILPHCEVLRLEATKDRVERVVCRHEGKELQLSAKIVILAAGALNSPVILLRSRSPHWENGLSNRSDQVGRNLMMHASEYLAVRPKKNRSAEGPHKAISTNHFYVTDGYKLGNLHSMGVPIVGGMIAEFLKQKAEKDQSWFLKVGKPGRKAAGIVGQAVFGRAVLMSTIVEDLPYAENRVVLDDAAPDGRRIDYTYPDELQQRSALFDESIQKMLKGRLFIRSLTGSRNLNWGHVCGTCRAGEDPATSVVDGEGRSHDVENLFVADSSFFPASGGLNPSLTIAANALRIAEAVDRVLA